MQGKLTRVSRFGIQVEGHEGWLNYGNYYKGNKEFNTGDLVDVEHKGNFLVDVKVLSTSPIVATYSAPATVLQTPASVITATSNTGNGSMPSNRNVEIARMASVKAAVDIAPLLSNLDYSEAIRIIEDVSVRMTNYVLTGRYPDAVVNEETKQ